MSDRTTSAEVLRQPTGPAQESHPIRVLYLTPFATFGGATRSIVELISGLPEATIRKRAIVAKGVLEKGWFPTDVDLVPVRGLVQWDNTRFSRYRGLRWGVLLRELYNIPATIQALRAMRAAGDIDLIHCNEITLLPSAILAKRLLDVPLVVHVRSVQAGALAPLRSRVIATLLRRHANAVVAIDDAVARSLDPSVPVNILHNCIEIPPALDRSVNIDAPLTLGIVGSLTRSKGVVELVQACIELRTRGVPFHLLIAGENIRSLKGIFGSFLKAVNLAHDTEAEVRLLIARYDLDDFIELLGFVSKTEGLFRQLDVLCFPSLADAPGRPVFEAAVHGVPAIVAMRDPTRDVIEDGATGIVIDGPDPLEIADAVERFHRDRMLLQTMGREARERAAIRFDRDRVAQHLEQIYKNALKARLVTALEK